MSAAPRRGAGRIWSAVIVAAMVMGIVMMGGGPPALAAAPGVTTVVTHNGGPLVPGTELRSGEELTLRLQYTSEAVGQIVDIDLGAGVTVSDDFPSNSAVERIERTATGVRVVFKDPWPDISQGILDLGLMVDPIATSAPGAVSWNDGDEHSIPVVFVKNGDAKEDVEAGVAKAVSPGNLDAYVLKDQDGNYVGLDPAITGRDLSYTLTVSTPAGQTRAEGFTVSDLLPAGLGYVAPLTVTATETTWDANGYNASEGAREFSIDASSPNAFDGQVVGPLVGPSVLTLAYLVRVTDVAALDAALRAAFDARNGSPGAYEIGLRNTATFGGSETAQASVRLRGVVAGPCPSCGAFEKTSDLATVNALTRDDGRLLDPVDIVYTFRATLAQWDGHSPNFELEDNVVIRDDLLAQASWTTGAGFLEVSGAGPISALADAGQCPSDASAFAADTFVGHYCLEGQTLLMNVGRSSSTDIRIAAKARLHTVSGLTEDAGIEGGHRYRVRNSAVYAWGDARYTAPRVEGYVVVPDAEGVGVTDASAFTKASPDRLATRPNEPLEVPFTFTVDTARTGVPAAESRIIDHVDTRFFPLDPELSTVTVAGSYSVAGTSTPLAAGDFTVNRVGDDVEIMLSDAGKAKAAAPGGRLTVNLTLVTAPFDGKETIDIVNRATLKGAGPEPRYVAEVELQGTSFGAESETRKHVYDRQMNGGEWAQIVTADGESPVYVYRLQFIGHPGFGGVEITPEKDVLPAGLEFVGFVDEADKATGAGATLTPVTSTEGNLVATFDPAEGPRGTITLTQQEGTVFDDGSIASIYFAARLTDTHAPVVNDFGDARTTLVPDEPDLDIEKWVEDGEGSGPEYDEYGALRRDRYTGDFDAPPGKAMIALQEQVIRLTVSNDGPEPVQDLVVADRLVSGTGAVRGLVCTFPDGTAGTSWTGPLDPGVRFDCEARLPALAPGSSHTDIASVQGVGVLSGLPVEDADEWHGSTAPSPGPGDDPDGLLASTGDQQVAAAVVLLSTVMIVLGVTLLAAARRRRGREAG